MRTTRLFEAAGRHFNRGQRAFFFALGYLGWFVSPWLLLATTALVVVVTWRRQFASNAWRAMGVIDGLIDADDRRVILCHMMQIRNTASVTVAAARDDAAMLRQRGGSERARAGASHDVDMLVATTESSRPIHATGDDSGSTRRYRGPHAHSNMADRCAR